MKKTHWMGRVLVALLLICIAVVLSINYYAKWRLQQEIERFSAQNSKGLYSLKVGNVEVDIWNGVLNASNILIATDTAKWAAIRQTRPDSFPPMLELSVDSFGILHFKILHYLMDRKAEVQAITFHRPILKIMQRRDTTERDSVGRPMMPELPNLIFPVADALKINQLSVTNADISFITLQESDSLKRDLTGLNLSFTSVDISKTSGEISFCKDIEIKAAHFETRRKEGKHLFSLDSFYLSKKHHEISFRHFSVAPIQSESAFFRQQRFRKPYLAFICPVLTITGFDLDRLLQHNYFCADTLQMERAKLILTSNKSLPLPYRKILPNEVARTTKAQFNIKNVVVKDSDIGVTTKEPGADYLITFNHLYVNANNLTNDSTLMDLEHPFELWVESKFMNRAPIKMNMRIPLLSPTLSVDYNAIIRNFPLSALNPVISHNNMRIQSGYMQKTEIISSVRKGVARGTVKIQYKDLEVEVLREDSRKIRKVITKIADMLVDEENVADNDPSTPFKTGIIYHVRNRQEEFFVFLWHSLQTGLLPTIVPAYDKLKK